APCGERRVRWSPIWSPALQRASKPSSRSAASAIARRCRARTCRLRSATVTTSSFRSRRALRSRRRSRPRSSSPASTSRRSGRWRRRSVRSAGPNPTRGGAGSRGGISSPEKRERRSGPPAMADSKKQAQRRKARVRGAIKAASGRARLSVFRSSKHIYAQVIDDRKGETLVSASSVEKDMRGGLKTGADIAAAKAVGKLLAERAASKGITELVFDRGSYRYHGRVKALADAAREGGLKF